MARTVKTGELPVCVEDRRPGDSRAEVGSVSFRGPICRPKFMSEVGNGAQDLQPYEEHHSNASKSKHHKKEKHKHTRKHKEERRQKDRTRRDSPVAEAAIEAVPERVQHKVSLKGPTTSVARSQLLSSSSLRTQDPSFGTPMTASSTFTLLQAVADAVIHGLELACFVGARGSLGAGVRQQCRVWRDTRRHNTRGWQCCACRSSPAQACFLHSQVCDEIRCNRLYSCHP